jgi:hypothetical protein
VRAIFDQSGTASSAKSRDEAEKAATGSISGIDPVLPESGVAAQVVRFTGSGFQKGLTVTLIDPRGTKHTLSANSLLSVSPSLIAVTSALDQPGEWKATVTNPGEPASDVLRFSVAGPPTITSLNPASPDCNANAQKVVLIGEGFMDGLSLRLTNPVGPATVLPAAAMTSISPTQVVVNCVLPTAGEWQAVINNPGNRDSAVFHFSVAGPPTITGLQPAAPAGNANAQGLVFIGEGFMNGLSAKLTNPAGATTILIGADITAVTATRVEVNGVLTNPGAWRVVISNPGNRDSAAFPFNVM